MVRGKKTKLFAFYVYIQKKNFVIELKSNVRVFEEFSCLLFLVICFMQENEWNWTRGMRYGGGGWRGKISM